MMEECSLGRKFKCSGDQIPREMKFVNIPPLMAFDLVEELSCEVNDLNLIPKHIFLYDIPYSLCGCTIWQDRIGGQYVSYIYHRVSNIFGPVSDTKFRGDLSLIVYCQEEQSKTLPESISKINLDFENNPLSDLENAYNNDLQNKDNKMDALPEASQKPYNLRYKPKRKRLSDIYCTTTPECLENENGPSDELLAKYLQKEEYHRM